MNTETSTEYKVIACYGSFNESEEELVERFGYPRFPPAFTVYDREQAIHYCLSIQRSIVERINMNNKMKASEKELEQGYFDESGGTVCLKADSTMGFIYVKISGEIIGHEILVPTDDTVEKCQITGMTLCHFADTNYWWKFIPTMPSEWEYEPQPLRSIRKPWPR